MKTLSLLIYLLIITTLFACNNTPKVKKRIIAIPVYGQSLALGEEAIRITNFDSLSKKTNHTFLTENLDEQFGYLSDTHFKQWMKKIINDRERAFELSIYGMSEVLAEYFRQNGNDSIMICSFPGGQGASGILEINKGSKAYEKFLDEIKTANDKAKSRGWDFVVPAFCWMQGEDDIVWKKSKDYKKDLKKIQMDFNSDIKSITNQKNDVICISYQANCLTLSQEFKQNSFYNRETLVPQAQMELIRDDSLFMASGPTYPYNFVSERVHLDGISQKRLGYLAGLSVIKLMEAKKNKGLVPLNFSISKDTISISFNIPYPPLIIDSTAVLKADGFGFSVINQKNENILSKVVLRDNKVNLICKHSPIGSKVKYAVNGITEKSGYRYGPRGNLRDSQGEKLFASIQKKKYPLHNWCYQFDVLVK